MVQARESTWRNTLKQGNSFSIIKWLVCFEDGKGWLGESPLLYIGKNVFFYFCLSTNRTVHRLFCKVYN